MALVAHGWLLTPTPFRRSSSPAATCRPRTTTAAMLQMMSTPQFNRDRRPVAPPPPINQFIKADKVRLIAPGNDTGDDVMLGIYSLADALKEAEKYEVDLVMINDKGDPPVCKIIDYGKYKYAMEKKKKENMKKQVNVDIKEVKMSYKIDQHDFDVRVRAVRKFLGEGDKVKVIVQFKGREMQHKELGRDLLQKIFTPIEDIAAMESTPKVEGRSMAMLLGPKKTT
jgi:translation initiation factor IF-3